MVSTPTLRTSALAVVVLTGVVGCSVVDGFVSNPEVVGPVTTAVVVAPGEVVPRELNHPGDVEAFVREFGECAVEAVPGAALRIGFDRSTGFAGGSEAVAPTDSQLEDLELAIEACDLAMGFWAQVNAYAARTSAATPVPAPGMRLGPDNSLTFGASARFAD